MTLRTTLTRVACAALLLGAAGCNKSKSNPSPDQSGDKTAEQTNPTPPPRPAEPPTAEQMVKAYQDCYAALNAKNWDALAGCYADDAESQVVTPGMPALHGADIVNRGLKQLTTAFPDLQVKPQLIFQSGNKIASLDLMTGTHKGPLITGMGELPPSGMKINMMVGHLVEMAPDKPVVAKEYHFVEFATLLGQMKMNKLPHRDKAEEVADQPTIIMAKSDDRETAALATQTKLVAAFNAHSPKQIAPLLADDYTIMDAASPTDAKKKEELAINTELFQGFPDLHMDIEDAGAAGDYVVFREHMTGTNTGKLPSMGLDKTGKKMDVHGMEVFKVNGGAVERDYLLYDGAAMAVSLGLMKGPDGAPGAGAAGKKPGKRGIAK